MPVLVDCTNALGVPLAYDRGPDGYGVPYKVGEIRFKGTDEFRLVLEALGRDLKQIGWLPYIENFLTAGLYVDKPGAHGKGIAWDFDGVVIKQNPLYFNDGRPRVLCYKSRFSVNTEKVRVISLPDRIRTRFDCLMSLRFGVVLTQGYPKHHDHGHYDLSREVRWRGSKSQVILLQEALNAFFNAGLVVDGIYGDKTEHAWIIHGRRMENTGPSLKNVWLDWLKMIAFNPPKDVNHD